MTIWVGDDIDTDGLVVCCRSCNTNLRGRSGDVKRRMLMPVPKTPYFSKSSASFINNSAWASERGIKVKASLRPGEILDARIDGSSNGTGGNATQVLEEEIADVVGGTTADAVEPPHQLGNCAPHDHISGLCSASCCHTDRAVVEEDIASLSGGAGEAWLEPLRETGKRLPTVDQGACVVSVHGTPEGVSEAPTKRGSCDTAPSVGVAKAARRRHSRRRSQNVGETR